MTNRELPIPGARRAVGEPRRPGVAIASSAMTAEGARSAITALRRSHDQLAGFAQGADPGMLQKQSGCSEWTVADVLSHLGSASEIGLATLQSGKADMAAAPVIWDRWNAMSPAEKAGNFAAASGRLADALEALTDEDLETRRIDMGFLPEPIDVASFAGMRLIEIALHKWDVDVAFDPAATVDGYTIPHLLGALTSFAGYFAKPAGKSGIVGVTLTDPSRSFTLRLTGDGAQLEEGPAADAGTSAAMPAEAFVRLIAGRLDPGHTPPSARVDGDLSLDDLRQIFPGL